MAFKKHHGKMRNAGSPFPTMFSNLSNIHYNFPPIIFFLFVNSVHLDKSDILLSGKELEETQHALSNPTTYSIINNYIPKI